MKAVGALLIVATLILCVPLAGPTNGCGPETTFSRKLEGKMSGMWLAKNIIVICRDGTKDRLCPGPDSGFIRFSYGFGWNSPKRNIVRLIWRDNMLWPLAGDNFVFVFNIPPPVGVSQNKSAANGYLKSGTGADVGDSQLEQKRFIRLECPPGNVASQVGSNLSLTNVSCNLNRPASFGYCVFGCARSDHGSPARLAGLEKRPNESDCTDNDRSSLNERIIAHVFGCDAYRLRAGVHSLLGREVIYLALAAFFFAGLAGAGGFLAFDDNNRNAKRRAFGLALFLGGGLISFGLLLLGLP